MLRCALQIVSSDIVIYSMYIELISHYLGHSAQHSTLQHGQQCHRWLSQAEPPAAVAAFPTSDLQQPPHALLQATARLL